jgi:alkane 1-monooxygenase
MSAPPDPRPEPGTQPWRDPKRLWWLLSALLPALVWFNLLRFSSSGQTAWLWQMTLFVYVVIPLLDLLLGEDARNPPESALAGLEGAVWYRALVVLYVPLQFAVTVCGAWIAATHELSALGWAGLVLSVGGINGVAINTAHELGHKTAAWERWLARITLAPVAYGHFYVEHNRGHHARVATLADPASARLGESYWAFLPRTLLGSLRSAWQLEALRLRAQGRPAVSWRNQNLQAWAMTLALYAALCAGFGVQVLPFLLVQALYGISLLEVVNYIEHYGLLRAAGPGGRPVRCTPQHSWNSSHVVSNLFLYHLQRHSDHHAHPARRFQALRHFAESPQLPAGYAAMLLIAYVPPLWFAAMDKRVLAHYAGDVTRANLHPPRRALLLARHARVAS